MKFWTVQSKNVIKVVNEEGIFEPDFNKSRYLDAKSDLKDLYQLVLQAFNAHNNMSLQGIVYAFAQSDSRGIFPIKDINDFSAFIQEHSAVVYGFWKELNKDNVEIVELVYNEEFNPIFVDINDFQFLMPPIMPVYPYTKESIGRIATCIAAGKVGTHEFPSHVIQAHLPYIKKENIVNTYPIFELE